MFLKYPSIENHYQGGTISRWLSQFPEIQNELFTVTEKLDGANFQIIITDDAVQYASRNQLLEIDSNFFDWQRLMLTGENARMISALQDLLHQDQLESLHVYGELYGAGVQKRIDYGPDKYFRVFEMRVNGDIQPSVDTQEMLSLIGFAHKFVPVLAEIRGLQAALDYELPEGAEGVVIAPANRVYAKDTGETFRLKKKSKVFNDQMKVKTGKTPKLFVSTPEYEVAYAIWESYFSDNRLADLFSKEGYIESPQQIGRYIKLMSDDVKVDFFKDHKDLFIALEGPAKGALMKSGDRITLSMLQKALDISV